MNPTADIDQVRRHHLSVLRELHNTQKVLLELSTAAVMYQTDKTYSALALAYQQMADDLVTSDTESYSGSSTSD